MDEQLQQELTDLRNAALFNMALYDAAVADAQKLKDRIEELERDKARLESEAMYGAAVFQAGKEKIAKLEQECEGLREQLRDELEACRKDADRYRWLRANNFDIGSYHHAHEYCASAWFEYFDDAAIDAAMQEETKP